MTRTLADTVAQRLGTYLDGSVESNGDEIILPLYAPSGTVSLAIGISQPSPYVATVTDAAISRACRIVQKETGDLSGYLSVYGVTFDHETEQLATQARLDLDDFSRAILQLRDACLMVLAMAEGLEGDTIDPRCATHEEQSLKLALVAGRIAQLLTIARRLHVWDGVPMTPMVPRETLVAECAVTLMRPSAADRARERAEHALDDLVRVAAQDALLSVEPSHRQLCESAVRRLASTLMLTGTASVLAGYQGALDGGAR